MAQNVTVAGASYSDVPSVVLPKTGGGSAQFDDTTIASDAAVAADISFGKKAYVNGSLVTGTNQGGGGVDAGQVYQDANGYLVLDDDGGGRYDPSDATATAADILSPKTAYVSGGKVTGNIATKTQSDLTASGATVTVPAGYYASNASKSVASGSVSASATKSISSHTATVTPSASVTAGYISSGATGTAVTVTASELVSGTKSITANGTGIDVSEFAAVDVAVSGGGGLEYETGTWSPASDIADYTIQFANAHATAPFYYLIYDTGTNTYSSSTNSMVTATSFGGGIPYNATTTSYGTTRSYYSGSAAGTNMTTTESRDDYFSSSGIRAYTNATTRYWRSGHTYNWIAVWLPTS